MSSERNYYEVDAHLNRLQPDLFGSASVISEENDDLEVVDLRSLFDALREFDAKIHVTVDRLTSAAVHVDDLELAASLSDGSLVLSRYHMLFMGSQVEAEALSLLNNRHLCCCCFFSIKRQQQGSNLPARLG